jgi:hypothetical protein
MGFKSGQFFDQVFVYLLVQFWIHFGAHFGFRIGQEAPRWAQEGFQEPQSTEKQHLQKVLFSEGKQCFLSLGGSQDEHKTLKTALKRHLESFKTRKKGFQKLTYNFTVFDPVFGPIWGPKWVLKIVKKGFKIGSKMESHACQHF